MADLGLAQLYDMRTNAEMIANLDPFGPPLIADMDTGYGGRLSPYPQMTVRSLIYSRSLDGIQVCSAVHPGWRCWLPH